MGKKLPVNIISLLMIYALLVLPLLYTHTCTFANVTILLVAVFSFYVIGAIALLPAGISKLFLPLSHAVLSVFIGGLAFSMLLFVSANPLVLAVSLPVIFFLILFLFRKEVELQLSFSLPDIVLLVVGLLIVYLISIGQEMNNQFTAVQAGTFCVAPDNYFFTSIVSSFRHGSIFSAVYETGSPVNYQALSFYIPAVLANMLRISSHQALWGLSLPFYKLLTLLVSYELFYFFLKDKVARNNYWFIIVASALPILLAPLHPLYILKGDVHKFIFNGFGYLIPSGSITYPLAITLFLFSMLLFYKADWRNKRLSGDKVLFVLMLALLAIAKGQLYFCVLLFYGIIAAKRIFIEKERITGYIGYFFSAVALSVLLLKVSMGAPSGAVSYFKYGYLAELFAGWYHRSSAGAMNNLIIIGLIVFAYLFWLSIRLLGVVALVKTKQSRLIELLTGGVVALIGATVLASFLRFDSTDGNGHIFTDNTFNVQGFIRAAFYILTIASVTGILYLLYGGLMQKKYINGVAVLIALWCGISLVSLVSVVPDNNCEHSVWYDENYKELSSGKYNDGLIAVNPAVSYYGIMIASSDQGRYWTAMDRSSANYNCTIINQYRWQLFQQLLKTPDAKFLEQMKREGVKYIITTPADSAQFSAIGHSFSSNIRKVANTGWIYELQ